mgnify:CR=1 FL=1
MQCYSALAPQAQLRSLGAGALYAQALVQRDAEVFGHSIHWLRREADTLLSIRCHGSGAALSQ